MEESILSNKVSAQSYSSIERGVLKYVDVVGSVENNDHLFELYIEDDNYLNIEKDRAGYLKSEGDFNDGYKAIYSLRALGALHENPITDEDTAELNFALAENLNTIDINTVTWENPLSVTRKHKTGIFSNDLCQQLKASDDYNALDEDDNWFNNGYLTDVVIPLIRAAIKDIPNFNYMRVTTSEMESKNSKERWKLQKCSSFGKKPDAMIIATICNIEFEIMFLEGSRLVADKGKRHSDSVKLWRGSNDGIWLASLGTTTLIKPNCHLRIQEAFSIINLLLKLRIIIIVDIGLFKSAVKSKFNRNNRKNVKSSTTSSPGNKKLKSV
ncbi:hypothetical protein GLOIN_2v1776879 [Rhizophagus irregularis DAOM 181602=DAOM 197198]|uniref:Uncharacterized protein n=2 Tax=Rhizophagus irregularis TaxID=588596 RepID=A0A2P4PVZ5_RHIID|nr:hypothetical protein GLOIN_2v1776879 [Rhizophagus irregularis DAOM 181602=DAOM 197198]POG69550.1 hypothetical protein GLOIN_2v1776879 [Rhizophagus irregularis DAOM 181602=DAOM 197198]|eukprot:XP_025176416.1 hypothetical protein GLOIN_2v1776879 [Rhizophagus irregularis DAOM 181602=DAOM 197198]